jgi:malignant T-cell-amplified sequence
MRSRDARQLIEVLSKNFGNVQAEKVEVAEFEEKKIYILNDKIEFLRDENGIYPFLGGNYLDFLPQVVIDMGAIRFVCNGADVMAPGIVETSEFSEGSVIVIRDVTHGKALAIGVALKSNHEIESSIKGKVIKNIHYVGDKLWENISV